LKFWTGSGWTCEIGESGVRGLWFDSWIGNWSMLSRIQELNYFIRVIDSGSLIGLLM